jgi:hypothetical protein
MNERVETALALMNDLILNQGWEWMDAFDRAGTHLGTKDLNALRQAYDAQ